MNINKLGHQKKLALALNRLRTVAKQPAPVVKARAPSASQHPEQHANSVAHRSNSVRVLPFQPVQLKRPSPAERPQSVNPAPHHPAAHPGHTESSQGTVASGGRPVPRPKAPKSVSSFQESPGLSLELQRALSRRQQVIDNAEKQSSSPDTHSSQAAQPPSSPPTQRSHDVEAATGHSLSPVASKPSSRASADSPRMQSAQDVTVSLRITDV